MQSSNRGLKLIIAVSGSQMLFSKGKSGQGQRAPEAKSINRLPFTYEFTFFKKCQVPDENSGWGLEMLIEWNG